MVIYQYFKLDRCEYVGVCPCVTDVTSLPQRVLWERGYNVYRNAYAGNESPKTVGAVDASFIAP